MGNLVGCASLYVGLRRDLYFYLNFLTLAMVRLYFGNKLIIYQINTFMVLIEKLSRKMHPFASYDLLLYLHSNFDRNRGKTERDLCSQSYHRHFSPCFECKLCVSDSGLPATSCDDQKSQNRKFVDPL